MRRCSTSGSGPRSARFVALYDAENRRDLIGEVMSVGLVTSLLIGVGLSVLSISSPHRSPTSLAVSSTAGMRGLLLAATCMFVCSTLVNALTAHRVGLRRMIAPEFWWAIGAVVNFAFSVGAVLISNSLVFYGLANAAASVDHAAAHSRLRTRPEGRSGAPYRRPTLATTKHLISFAVRNQMQAAASLINNQTDKIVIAIFIGPLPQAPTSLPIG